MKMPVNRIQSDIVIYLCLGGHLREIMIKNASLFEEF